MVDYCKILSSGSPMVCTPAEATHIIVDGVLHPKNEAPLYLTDNSASEAEMVETIYQYTLKELEDLKKEN